MDALPLGAPRRSADAACANRIARLDETRRADATGAVPTRQDLLPNRPKKTKESKNEMTTEEFISALRRTPDQPLLFLHRAGHIVHRGYHLTEIKAAHFDTVDCGGQVNHWRETIVQLWVPEHPDATYMTAGKFLKIFEKVSGMVPLDRDAEVRVEYGDENFFPSIYHVRGVAQERNTTRVLLEPPATTCKARDRRLASASESCCGATVRCCA